MPTHYDNRRMAVRLSQEASEALDELKAVTGDNPTTIINNLILNERLDRKEKKGENLQQR